MAASPAVDRKYATVHKTSSLASNQGYGDNQHDNESINACINIASRTHFLPSAGNKVETAESTSVDQSSGTNAYSDVANDELCIG
jgi:hypothetical protein